MGLVDFKTDRAEMVGQRVQLSGFLRPFASDGLLASGPDDLAPVFVDVRGVERDQRRKFFACESPCYSIVTGRVGTVGGSQIGIIADDLRF
jgi:hypothetical protein